jgi:flagellum-specific ATP synthase
LGHPIDSGARIDDAIPAEITGMPPDALRRRRVTEALGMGVRVIDGLLTCGKGQRVGIFSGSGVGKSTLLGMIARNTTADVNVIALVGERGKEVRDFIERDLGEAGLKRSVVVVATSDQPALVRIKAAYVATRIAEFFRDAGLDVMFMMDSVTRFAMAQREVGLAIGEPTTTRGYTPSVFAALPKLLERAGTSETGTITALYTVLVEGDDLNEPVADAVRAILDGHIVLSRRLASANQFPAVDVLASVSRVMPDVVTDAHFAAASKVRDLMATYREAEDLINIGAYVAGSNPRVDLAIARNETIRSFTRQGIYEKSTLEEAQRAVTALG